MTTNTDMATTTDSATVTDDLTTPPMTQQTNKPDTNVYSLPPTLMTHVKWVVLGFFLVVLAILVAVGVTLRPNMRQPLNATGNDADALLTQEMLRIGDDLQCPVCAGQSVAYSNSQLAAEMRLQILEQLRAGADEAAIKQYFVDRYGEVVLREPLRTGLNLWLWRLPMIGLAVGLAIFTWMLRQTNRNRRLKLAEAGARSDIPATEIDPDVQSLLTQYDKELFR